MMLMALKSGNATKLVGFQELFISKPRSFVLPQPTIIDLVLWFFDTINLGHRHGNGHLSNVSCDHTGCFMLLPDHISKGKHLHILLLTQPPKKPSCKLTWRNFRLCSFNRLFSCHKSEVSQVFFSQLKPPPPTPHPAQHESLSYLVLDSLRDPEKLQQAWDHR